MILKKRALQSRVCFVFHNPLLVNNQWLRAIESHYFAVHVQRSEQKSANLLTHHGKYHTNTKATAIILHTNVAVWSEICIADRSVPTRTPVIAQVKSRGKPINSVNSTPCFMKEITSTISIYVKPKFNKLVNDTIYNRFDDYRPTIHGNKKRQLKWY